MISSDDKTGNNGKLCDEILKDLEDFDINQFAQYVIDQSGKKDGKEENGKKEQ